MAPYRLLILVVVFFALQLLILSGARAEYRVYLLGVKYAPQAKEIQVLTTLDNLQYETYYKLTAAQETRLIDHWMCFGRTDGMKPYCKKPVLTREPASVNVSTTGQGPVSPPVPSVVQ